MSDAEVAGPGPEDEPDPPDPMASASASASSLRRLLAQHRPRQQQQQQQQWQQPAAVINHPEQAEYIEDPPHVDGKLLCGNAVMIFKWYLTS